MKKAAVLLGLLAALQTFQAQADEDVIVQSLYCASSVTEMTIEKYQSGTVSWVVNEASGETSEFMGFVGSETKAGFYSTDLGSDLQVKDGRAYLTLTRFEERSYVLACTPL
jgi:hypothetical protein